MVPGSCEAWICVCNWKFASQLYFYSFKASNGGGEGGGCEIPDILFGLMNLEEDSGNIENVHDWS